jgi:hypothetical protein
VSARLKSLTVLASLIALTANAQMAGWSDFGQNDLTQPDRVVERLRRGSTPAERQFEIEVAKSIASDEKDRRAGKGRGPNAKDYMELAVASPTPRHLIAASDALLNEFFVQSPPANRPKNIDEWIIQHADFLSSAIAGNAVVPQLTEKELHRSQHERNCAKEYIATKSVKKNCRPVQIVLRAKR